MDLVELFSILKQGEGPHIEFKREFPKQAHDIAKEIVALANHGGGVLLIGVEDNGDLVEKGVPDSQRAVERLAGIARSCSPPLLPEIDRIQLANEVFVVYARIPHSPPSMYQGKIYIRVGSVSAEASGGDELKTLIQNKKELIRPAISNVLPSTPPPTRSFKGRANELKRLANIMESKNITVAVIEGISGIGKTALAAYFATTINQFNYIPFWLDCREDTSFDQILTALACFVRNSNNTVLAELMEDVTIKLEDRIARVATAISECKYILFFDDYHLISDPFVNRLLQKIAERAVAAKVFLVCRLRPRLAATISPMLLVEETLRAGLDVEACTQLLAECNLVVPKKVATKIWKLTGEGHPKALEIFVARSRSYPVSDLLSSLPVFNDELKSEWLLPLMEELPKIQKEIAIDLSIFDRPIPIQAINSLYSGQDPERLIIGLVDRFIVDRTADDLLRMHMLVREFCYTLIKDSKEKHIWAANYYLDQHADDSDLDLADDAHIDDRIAAWSHLIKAGEHVRATDEVNRLRAPLMNRGQYEQVMFLIEQTPVSPGEEDWILITKARILSLWGDYSAAFELIRPLVDSPDERISRESILVLSTIYTDHNKNKEAKSLLEDKRSLYLHNVKPIVQRRFLTRLAEIYSKNGDYQEALSWASKITETCEAEGDEIGGAFSLRQMAIVLQAQKNFELAMYLAKISHSLFSRNKRLREMALTELLISSIHLDLSDSAAALQHLQSALHSFTRMGDRKNIVICRQKIGQLVMPQ